MGFLSTLLYILLGFYVIKFILRLLAPKLMAFALKRLQKKMYDRFSSGFGGSPFGASAGGQNNEPTTSKNKKSFSRKDPVGEYIDFEEIE